MIRIARRDGLPLVPEQVVGMPTGAQPFAVQLQRGQLALFATVDDAVTDVTGQSVFVVEAGDAVPDSAQYVGSVQDGSRAWFIYVG